MMNIVVAVAAGCAAGLMFASIISGALISLLLFYLAPLPLMVAALGWGPASALIGAATASAGLGLMFGLAYLLTFIITVGLPAYWLGYLALLAKPAAAGGANGAPAPLEWYPSGRLLLWIAAFACLITVSALMTLGSDYETITAALRRGLQRVIGARGETVPNTDTDRVLDAITQIAPAAATLVAMSTLTLNVYLSGKIVMKSGRLRRPWPDLRMIDLPQTIIIVLAVALVLSFLGGLLGMLSQIATAALLLAYAMVGLAVLHAVTQSSNARWWWLAAVYGAIVFFVWPVVLLAVVGLVDGPIGLRRRFGNRPKPPTLST
jgi:hypothetical protein